MAQTDVFTSSGTWVAPSDVTSVSVECWAGGGGGGSCNNFFGQSGNGGGGGGGGGAYSKLNTFTVTPGNSYTVTVGQGGPGAPFTASFGSFATDGGDSWFNSTGTVLAKGGKGGENVASATSAVSGGVGGASASGVGNVKHSGGDAGGGVFPTSTSGGGGGGAGSTGDGGSATGPTGGSGTTIGGGNGANGISGTGGQGVGGSLLGGGGSGGTGQFANGGNGGGGQVSITYTAISQFLTTEDSSAVSDTPRIILPGTHSSPVITFRNVSSPWAVLTGLSYDQLTPAGDILPVLQQNLSEPVFFRIYNNFLLVPNIADAMNVSITSFDGVGVHTASMPVASQAWVHVLEYGFGQGASAPGLYTETADQDHTIGGVPRAYNFPWGSDGLTPATIRAGTTGRGCGFIEAETYIRVPSNASGGLQSFALSASFDWVT